MSPDSSTERIHHKIGFAGSLTSGRTRSLYVPSDGIWHVGGVEVVALHQHTMTPAEDLLSERGFAGSTPSIDNEVFEEFERLRRTCTIAPGPTGDDHPDWQNQAKESSTSGWRYCALTLWDVGMWVGACQSDGATMSEGPRIITLPSAGSCCSTWLITLSSWPMACSS